MQLFPVPGHYLMGVPAVPLEVDDEVAERLLRTGAFTDEAPDEETPAPVELDAAALEALDFYDPPAEPATDTGDQPVDDSSGVVDEPDDAGDGDQPEE